MKRNLYNDVPTKCIQMSFSTHTLCKQFGYFCQRRHTISECGVTFDRDAFKVHEQNIDPIIKFATLKHIKLANWITVTEIIPPGEELLTEEERKFSSADVDMWCYWNDVSPCKKNMESVSIRPKAMSFDLETYSKNHNSRQPDPKIKENVIIQNGIVIGRINDPPSRKKILLTLR